MTAIQEGFRTISQVVRPRHHGVLAPLGPQRLLSRPAKKGSRRTRNFGPFSTFTGPLFEARDPVSADRETGIFVPQGARTPWFEAWRLVKWSEIPRDQPSKSHPKSRILRENQQRAYSHQEIKRFKEDGSPGETAPSGAAERVSAFRAA